MAGKYADIQRDLPRLAPDADKPAFLEAVTAAKASVTDRSLDGLAATWLALRAEKDRYEAEIEKPLNIRIRAVEHLLFDAYSAAGLDAPVAARGGGRIQIQTKLSTSIRDRGALIRWLRETGREELLTVNAQTMSKFVGETLLDGGDVPPGVEVGVYQAVSK